MSVCNHRVSCLAGAVLLVIFCMAAGCSSYQAPAPATAAPAQPGSTGGANTVTMKNFAFDPQVLTVKPGTSVMWVNQDSATHTVTSDTGSPEAFSSDPLSTGGTYTRTFTTSGTYSYHCSIHPSMKGTITVQQ